MRNKIFKVIARDASFPKSQIDLIEGIINQPAFVDKVTRATELFIQRFMMPEILYGKTFSEEEKEKGYEEIVKKVSE